MLVEGLLMPQLLLMRPLGFRAAASRGTQCKQSRQHLKHGVSPEHLIFNAVQGPHAWLTSIASVVVCVLVSTGELEGVLLTAEEEGEEEEEDSGMAWTGGDGEYSCWWCSWLCSCCCCCCC